MSHRERLAVVQRIRQDENISVIRPMWLAPQHVDRYFEISPRGETEITAEEAAIARVFGKDGELPAARLSQQASVSFCYGASGDVGVVGVAAGGAVECIDGVCIANMRIPSTTTTATIIRIVFWSSAA